jgi:hypothetical protein
MAIFTAFLPPVRWTLLKSIFALDLTLRMSLGVLAAWQRPRLTAPVLAKWASRENCYDPRTARVACAAASARQGRPSLWEWVGLRGPNNTRRCLPTPHPNPLQQGERRPASRGDAPLGMKILRIALLLK